MLQFLNPIANLAGTWLKGRQKKAEIKQKHDKISQVELTDLAYKHDKYKKWLDNYSKRAKEKTLKSDLYNNRVALKDMRITEESSARYLIKKG